MEKLSTNFTVSDFTSSPTAKARKILNIPTSDDVLNMKNLCVNILEPVLTHFKKPVKINSGFRSASLNIAIGGSKTSQHCNGEAVDFEIFGIPNKTVAEWISKNCNFDQLILEFYNPAEGINSGWVHISLERGSKNRKQKLVAYKDGKSTHYVAVTDFSNIK